MRAKFVCESVTETVSGKNIKLHPVCDGSEENKSFYKWTPGGEIFLSVVNKEASAIFIPGHNYYVDFTDTEN